MRSYKDLLVWRKSIQLVKQVYLVTDKFPTSEKFGLVNQLRRASVSIPSNIAEGYGRRSTRERRQFIALARGSASEVETQLVIAKELGFVADREFKETVDLLSEILKMLAGLSKSLS